MCHAGRDVLTFTPPHSCGFFCHIFILLISTLPFCRQLHLPHEEQNSNRPCFLQVNKAHLLIITHLGEIGDYLESPVCYRCKLTSLAATPKSLLFLFTGNRLSRPFAGTGIGMGTLATHRQRATMAQTTIAA